MAGGAIVNSLASGVPNAGSDVVQNYSQVAKPGGYNYFDNAAPITVQQYNAGMGTNISPTATPGAVLGAATSNGGGGSGGGGGTATATTDPRFAQQQAFNQNLISNLTNQYNTLFGQYNQGVQGLRQGIDTGYQDQQNALNNQYGQAMQQLPWMEAARGAADSSDAYTQQANAGQNFNTQSQGITDQRLRDEQALSSQASSQLGQYQGQLQNIQNFGPEMKNILPTDSNAAYEMSNIGNQLGGMLPTVEGALGSAKNAQALQQSLNVQAPSQVYNPQVLQGQLSALGQSSIPGFAQNQIASAAINNAVPASTDPTGNAYWLNYFKNLASPAAA